MIKSKNEYELVKLVDNRQLKTALSLEKCKVDGFEHLTQNLEPNEGYIGKKRVFFYPYGVVRLRKKHLVPQGNIFMFRNELCKHGILLKKETFENEIALSLGTSQFFRVTQSITCDIDNGNGVVIVPRSSYGFNIDGERFYFIEPNNVLMNISLKKRKILPGPDFTFLTEIKDDTLFEMPRTGCGADENGTIRHFTQLYSTVDLYGKKTFIVKTTDIYGEE